MSELQGKSALVTGASRGIGAAAAIELARKGASVVVAARTTERLHAVVDEIRANGGKAEAVACDVADYGEVAAAVSRAVDCFAGLDVLVNNAGIIEPIAPLGEADPDAWGRLIDVNVKGVYHGVRAALPVMVAAGAGVVVNISSGAAARVFEGWSAYCASKAAVLALTRSIEEEYASEGIRAVGLSPGTVATEMQRVIKASGINPVSQLEWEDHIPPEWAGRAVAYLATDDAADLSGGDVSLRSPEIRARVGIG